MCIKSTENGRYRIEKVQPEVQRRMKNLVWGNKRSIQFTPLALAHTVLLFLLCLVGCLCCSVCCRRIRRRYVSIINEITFSIAILWYQIHSNLVGVNTEWVEGGGGRGGRGGMLLCWVGDCFNGASESRCFCSASSTTAAAAVAATITINKQKELSS